MGISKKKFKKSIKMTNEEAQQTIEAIHTKPKTLKSDFFTTNTSIDGLKKKREKLKADRFKEETDAKTSKTEE